MSEFKSHQIIVELLSALGAEVSPSSVIEIMQNNYNYDKTRRKAVIESYVQKLAFNSNNPRALYEKYEELCLKDSNDTLAPFLELLQLLAEEAKVKSFLELNANISTDNTNKVNTDQMTEKDLPEVITRIKASLHQKNDRSDSDTDRKGYKGSKERIHQSWDFGKSDIQLSSTNLSEIPVSTLENIVITDVLYVLFGLEGEYFIPEFVPDVTTRRTFKSVNNLPPYIKDIVSQILPLASNYSIIQRFIEDKTKPKVDENIIKNALGDIRETVKMPFIKSETCSQVTQALCSALTNLIKDYFAVVCQIESEHKNRNMNLVKFMYYIKPVQHTMEVLADIVIAISKSGAFGGRVLSLLHERASSLTGDIQAQKLCVFVTQQSCQPYMKILETWIHEGTIHDPYEEFLVEDNERISQTDVPVSYDYSADYWEKRYTIRRERVPRFLDNVADMVVRTGKYLNVIRQCGKNVKVHQSEPLVYNLSEAQLESTIKAAYSFASKTLLHLLMNDYDLTGRLRSVKHYFLLDQGDFIVQFMDSCEKELAKNIDDILPMRLESLLELTLRVSGAKVDPYKDDMRTELLPYDLQFQMFKILSIHTDTEKEYWHPPHDKLHLSGLESFTFGYDVKWPISLIINRRSIACYQMIFRHLFYCKHVERQLCGVWISNKEAKKFSGHVAEQYRSAFALRQRMLNCIQNLEYYMMVEVIEPSWSAFIQKINKVINVDEVLECHADFLDSTLRNCMITDPELLRTVTKLCGVCVEFCEFIQEMRQYYVDAELTSMLTSMSESGELSMSSSGLYNTQKPLCNPMEKSLDSSLSFSDHIKKFDTKFTTILITMLNKINDTKETKHNGDKLVNVVHRLNFNTYYSEQMDRIYAERTIEDPDFIKLVDI